jgi:hypothetical protein
VLAAAIVFTAAYVVVAVGRLPFLVAEGAPRDAPLTFAEYLKVGVPVTLLTLAAGVLLLA